MKNIIISSSILLLVTLVTFGLTFENQNLPQNAYAQNNNDENTQVLEQLISNLTKAKNTVSGNDSSVTTPQLTAIIGELSDIIGKITSDNTGQYHDVHTHIFTHKDHPHTVTHSHSHNEGHHSKHPSWFEKHHEADPSKCKPGLMC